MAKDYWVGCYRAIKDTGAPAEYAKSAGPALLAGTGRVQTFDAGIGGRTVVIEFPSFEQAPATHEGAAYQAAVAKLEGAVARDFRVVEGVE